MISVVEDGGVVITADLDLDVDEKGEDEEDEDDGDRNDVYSNEIDENGVGLAQRQIIIVRGGTLYSDGAITYNRDVSGYDDGDDDRGSDYGEYDESYDLDEEIMPRNGSKAHLQDILDFCILLKTFVVECINSGSLVSSAN